MIFFIGWHNFLDGRLWHHYPNPFSSFEDESVIPPPPDYIFVVDNNGIYAIDNDNNYAVVDIV